MPLPNGRIGVTYNPLIISPYIQHEDFGFFSPPPPPGSQFMITETSIRMITETDDPMITE